MSETVERSEYHSKFVNGRFGDAGKDDEGFETLRTCQAQGAAVCERGAACRQGGGDAITGTLDTKEEAAHERSFTVYLSYAIASANIYAVEEQKKVRLPRCMTEFNLGLLETAFC